jgi:hypothetical protein
MGVEKAEYAVANPVDMPNLLPCAFLPADAASLPRSPSAWYAALMLPLLPLQEPLQRPPRCVLPLHDASAVQHRGLPRPPLQRQHSSL